MERDQISDFIRDIITEAGSDLRARFGGKQAVNIKADTSFVTAADMASETILIERIRRAFPADWILSEEGGGASGTRRRPGSGCWVLDPLDGTTNFANGYPYFCVSVGRGTIDPQGLITITHGAIYEPMRERLFEARRGHGAVCNGQPLRVSHVDRIERAFLVTGFYYKRGDALERDIALFLGVAKQCQSMRRDGAAALDLAYVAEGIFDGFWEDGLQPWDVAAGSLLVAEAGGSVANYRPAAPAFDIEGQGIIAGNPAIYDVLRATIVTECKV